MAREIVSLCDVCLDEHDNRRNAATPTQVAFDGKPARVVDLCDEHRHEFVDGLRALVIAHGAPVETPTKRAHRKRGSNGTPTEHAAAAVVETLPTDRKRQGIVPASRDWACLWCPLDYGSAGGFTKHVRTAHGFTGLPDAYGDTCPACGASGFTVLSAHLQRAHPELGPNIAAAFAALRASDPHRVVAARVTAVK